MFNLPQNASIPDPVKKGNRTPIYQHWTSSLLFGFVLTLIFSSIAVAATPAINWSSYTGNESLFLPPSLTVTSPTVSKATQSTFVVPITVSDITGLGIFAFQFNVIYNHAVIDPSGGNFGCSTAGTLAASLSATCNVSPDGTLRVSVSGATPIASGSGTILNLTFTADPSAVAGNVSPLTFQSVFFFNGTGPVSSAAASGQVTLISVGPQADLSITKTDGTASVTAGTSTTYTIVASNDGPSTVTGATVTDTFPAAITSAAWTCSGAGGGTCTASGSGNISDSVNLPAGGSVTYTAVANIASNATGSLSNTASIVAPGGVTDPTPSNNSATDTDTITTPTPTPTPTPAAVVAFSATEFGGDESRTAAVTVSRSGNTSDLSSVTLTTSNGTASGGAVCGFGIDFVNTSELVTFASGEVSKRIDLVLCGDPTIDPDETIQVSLASPTGAVLGSQNEAVITVNDTANLFDNNADSITISTGGSVSAYPSTINVSGAPSSIGRLRVTLYGLWHIQPDDLDVLLTGPNGAKYLLMSATGGTNAISVNAPVTLTFEDQANQVLPDSDPLLTGAFKPTTCQTPISNFPGMAPVGPYVEPGCLIGKTDEGTLSQSFGGSPANGAWSLYVRDAGSSGRKSLFGGINGQITGGWGLEFLSPTSAEVVVSGRVTTSSGRGIRNATVVVNSMNGVVQTTTTSSFGYYRFEDIPAGGTYIITVRSKRYHFDAKLVQVFEDVGDIDFVGME